MKTNPGSFVDIEKNCNVFGNGIFQVLPGFHSITGCDTTSYPFGVGKMSCFKKMRCLSKMHLLQGVRKNIDSFKRLDKPKLFFQAILFSGKKRKFCLYKETTWQKSKIQKQFPIDIWYSQYRWTYQTGRFTDIYLETVHKEHHRIPRSY